MKKTNVPVSTFLALLLVLLTSLSQMPAKAEDDFREYETGKTIYISVCLPKKSKPPIQLYSLTQDKVISTFGTKTSWGGGAPLERKQSCPDGALFARYIAAKFKGTHEFAFYLPSTKKYYEATPFKFVEKQPYKGNPDDQYLDQPGLNFFRYAPGQAVLVNTMGINLGTNESLESFRSVIDQMYTYLCKRYETKITSADIDILFSPGGWGNNVLRDQIQGGGPSWGVLMRRLKVNAG